jgi:AraC family transcriptional regulator of adaptative response/methylated-DNA-[protein]-cysteine methyltransferase
LKAELQKEYPKAEIFEDDGTLVGAVKQVLEYLDGNEPRLDFPLDVRATAFQYRVWEELQKIPYGVTQSYSDIARMIGRPKAARAVARACATNPVALVIPCHRVIGRTGELTGYRWGKQRKFALLAQEKKRRGL